MSNYPKLKLTYFPIEARAAATRLAFYIGGVPFVDERLDHDTFTANKPTYPFGQVPVLEVDGHVFAQSQAMLRYAGRLAKLYPTNDPLAALKIDEILNGIEELNEKMVPAFREQDPEKKKQLRLDLANDTIPRYLSIIESRLKTHEKYAVLQTKDVHISDIAIYAWVKSLRAGYIDHIPTTVADGYPLVEASFQKVANHPKVVEWYAIQHTVPKLKLTYFPRPGRGEPIRLALHIAGIPFEDERITPEELAVRKPSLPFNQLPVLEVDGDVIAQSLAILRYVGTLSGLYPTNDPVLAFKIDELFCLIDDLHNVWGPSFREKDAEKQLALRKVLAEETIPKFLGHLNKRVGEAASEGSYATGATLTVADLAISALLNGLASGHMAGVPATVVRDQVHAHPKVVEWYQTHADH
uniref:Glutathione S-transferase n=1 Tax=Globisporangium ultimum (strain ATCC 200006 / CBS 805.95 / DAOM BR144) TaxID=431595 RepID=K3W6R3_GLOUD